MKRIIYILALALSIVACTEEIDKSNRYTFTGETVADYVLNRSDKYSHFITLLQRAKLLSLLTATAILCRSIIAKTSHTMCSARCCIFPELWDILVI